MSASWPIVALGDVLAHRKEFVVIDDLQNYRRPRVQLHAQGIVLRDEVPGALIKTKKQQVCRAGEFLVAEIDAKVGGFGLVPPSLDGAIVSSHYFLFVADEVQLDRRFLEWFVKTPGFRDQVEAQGSTNYAAIRSADVLGYRMPLPPLAEQRRIVARIEEVAGKVAQAQTARDSASHELLLLFERTRAEVFRDALNQHSCRLDELALLERGKFSHRPRNDARFFGGNHPWIQISEIESADRYITKWSQTLNDQGLTISKKFPKGTILISIAATIGAVGILEFDCCVPDSIVGLTPLHDTNSEFLYHYVGYIRNHLEQVAPQSAQKNINLQILSPLLAPRLPIEHQRQIASYLDGLGGRVAATRGAQAHAARELDALLPAVLDRAFKGEL